MTLHDHRWRSGRLDAVARSAPHPDLPPPDLAQLGDIVAAMPVERQVAAWARGVLWSHGTALLLQSHGTSDPRWSALSLALAVPWARARIASLTRATRTNP